MQSYNRINIVISNITETEKEDIPHYMLNIIQPNLSFSVAELQQHVLTYIDKITSKNKLPIIVGGSGLYIDAILYDYQFTNRERDPIITKKLEEKYKLEGIETLYTE